MSDQPHHLGPIFYHSEPSDVPYSPNQFLGLDFFVVSYNKTALISHKNVVFSEVRKLLQREFWPIVQGARKRMIALPRNCGQTTQPFHFVVSVFSLQWFTFVSRIYGLFTTLWACFWKVKIASFLLTCFHV